MLVGFSSQLYLKLQKNWFIAPYNFGTKCGLSTVWNQFHSLSWKICSQLGRSWHFQVEFLPSFCSLLAHLLTRKKRFSSKTITNLRKALIQLDYKTTPRLACSILVGTVFFRQRDFFFKVYVTSIVLIKEWLPNHIMKIDNFSLGTRKAKCLYVSTN